MLLVLGQRYCYGVGQSASARLGLGTTYRLPPSPANPTATRRRRTSGSRATRTSHPRQVASVELRTPLHHQRGRGSASTLTPTPRGPRRLQFHPSGSGSGSGISYRNICNAQGGASKGEERGTKILLLAGSATVAAAAASGWILADSSCLSPDLESDPPRLAQTFPSLAAVALWQDETATTAATAVTRCEQGSPHFGSAASLFQHHMSKEKEKDDAQDYHHPEDDHDHDEEHEHEAKQQQPECFLCRVHRQGPCGALWKDLEACVQNQDKNSNRSTANTSRTSTSSNDPCKVCASQFETCWKKHAGLYSLIALDEQSNDLHKLRKKHDIASDDSPLSNSAVKLDWDAWNQFLSNSPTASHDIVKNYRRRISQNGNIRFRGPLWKRFEKYQMTNPLLVRVSARIPRTISGGEQQVLYAVALDQQSRVLGFVEVPGEATTTAEATEDDNSLNMKIVIVPGLTESVKIQLWTTPAHGGGGESGSHGSSKLVLRESISQPVDYGASTNNMLALQNQRTRTEKVKATTAS
jgi:hypothetical protein